MEKMIQKSVRMPSSLVYYVNGLSGSDFSKKVVGILSEYRDGDVRRSLMLQRYDEQLADRRRRLCQLLEDISSLSRIHGRVLDLIHEVELAELFVPPEPDTDIGYEPEPGLDLSELPFGGLSGSAPQPSGEAEVPDFFGGPSGSARRFSAEA